MKKHILIPLLLTGFSLFAQPSRDIIKKYKIYYYQEFQMDKDAGDESSFIATWWFDRKGNDSMVYRRFDTLMPSYVFKDGKVMQRTYTNMKGEEKERHEYEYQADGSYKVTFTDGDYGLKSYEWYDKKDKIVKSQSPDGNGISYKYDTKGKLISVASDGKNEGIILRKKYVYNTKGQLSRLEYQMDENNSVINYEYNAKGQAIKQNEKGKEFGVSFTRTTIMDYNEKGLLKTRRADKKEEGGGWEKTNESFEYKYY